MPQLSLKAGLVKAIILAIALLGGVTACSTPTENLQGSRSTLVATDGSQSQGKQQGGMDHGSMMEMDHGAAMDLGPGDGEYDLRFVDAMILHHVGAVAMAKEAQQKSKRPEIQKLAAEIIQAQDQEINQMKQWRQAWYPQTSQEPVAFHGQMGHSMPMSEDQKKSMMMSMDLGAADDQFDRRFIDAMILHHEGAVVMAKDALTKSQRAEIQQLANEIIASQQGEIDQMKKWRKDWYNQ